MIRINLLGGPKPVAAAVAAPSAVAPSAIFVALALFVALGLVSAIFYFFLTRDIHKLDEDIAHQTREKQRLEPVRAQEQNYLRILGDLKQKKDTIDQLARSRVGPVELMRALGVTATRTNDIFLLSVGSQANRLAIRGQANRVESIADFLASLEQGGSFEDVQLRQSFENDKAGRTNYDFNLDCVFKSSASAGPEVPAAQGGTAPAPPGRRAGQ